MTILDVVLALIVGTTYSEFKRLTNKRTMLI